MLKNILFVTVFAFSGTAFAEILSLKVAGKDHFNGEKLFRLRHLVNQQLIDQGKNPDNFEFVGLSMRAKSRKGKAKATLIVGQDQDVKTVPAYGNNSAFFEITAPWSYNSINWDLTGVEGQSNERWQLRFNGNVKIRSIEVQVQHASHRVRIPMGDQIFSQNSTIRIKQELQRLGIKPKNKQLRHVTLVAKSRRGRGQVYLQVGQNDSPQKNIARSQNGFEFSSNRPVSYNRIPFNPRGNSQGVWQLHMRGQIKVKAVIVELK